MQKNFSFFGCEWVHRLAPTTTTTVVVVVGGLTATALLAIAPFSPRAGAACLPAGKGGPPELAVLVDGRPARLTCDAATSVWVLKPPPPRE